MVRQAAQDSTVDLFNTILFYQVPADIVEILQEHGTEKGLDKIKDSRLRSETIIKLERNEGYMKLLVAQIRALKLVTISGNAKSETVLNNFVEEVRTYNELLQNAAIFKLGSIMIRKALKIEKESYADLITQLAFFYAQLKSRFEINYIIVAENTEPTE